MSVYDKDRMVWVGQVKREGERERDKHSSTGSKRGNGIRKLTIVVDALVSLLSGGVG